ncbi:MAG: hypothetical protein ACRD12_14860, partial [Acidimicrobiales bacterium]
MISYALIANRFRAPLTAQTAPMVDLFDKLADAVKKLVEQADRAERATRAYPVLRYRDGAVCARVDVGAVPPLPSGPSLSVGEGFRQGGREFVQGLGWARTAVAQELALPRIVGVPLAALRSVVDSLERFSTARPSMFDDRVSRFSDVFGIANLGWSALLGRADQAEIRAAARGGAAAHSLLDILASPGGGDEVAPPEGAGLGGLSRSLEGTAQSVRDLLVVLPVVGLAIDVVLHDASIYAGRRILTGLRPVERAVYALPDAVADGILGVVDLGTTGHFFLIATDLIVSFNVGVLATGFPAWFDGLFTGVNGFLQGVTEWGQWVAGLAEAVRSVVDGFMNFDLLGPVFDLLIPPWTRAILPTPPRLTIDDLISLVIGDAVTGVRNALVTWFTAADLALATGQVVGPAALGDLRAKVAALREAVFIVLTPTPFTYPPDVMWTGPLAPFPNLYEEVFGGGRREQLVESVRSLGDELRAGVVGTLRGGADLAGGLARMSEDEGRRQARFGAGLSLRERESTSRAIAHDVFSSLGDEVRGRVAARPPDPLALAFEEAAMSTGIVTAAAAVPAYVGQMRRFWTARTAVEPRP